MTYLYVWRSGTFLLYSCKAAFWTQETLPRLSDVERSVVLRSVFAIGSTLTYLLFLQECATPPHVQVHHTMWLSLTRPPPTLVLQATNAGVRRPGYEANHTAGRQECNSYGETHISEWCLLSYSHLVDRFREHPPARAVPLASFPGYLCAAMAHVFDVILPLLLFCGSKFIFHND